MTRVSAISDRRRLQFCTQVLHSRTTFAPSHVQYQLNISWTTVSLRSPQWLPVRQRINFKLTKLCYLVTSFQQPRYLADLISPYSQCRLLRSSIQKLLSVPPHNLDTAARRFSVAAPRLWNSLPLNCRTASHLRSVLRHFSLIRHNRTVARASVLWRDID